jgi:hypothetical protein
MHELTGLADTTFQDRYYFTVSCTVDDERLTTLPAPGYQSAPIESEPADLLDLRQDKQRK